LQKGLPGLFVSAQLDYKSEKQFILSYDMHYDKVCKLAV